MTSSTKFVWNTISLSFISLGSLVVVLILFAGVCQNFFVKIIVYRFSYQFNPLRNITSRQTRYGGPHNVICILLTGCQITPRNLIDDCLYTSITLSKKFHKNSSISFWVIWLIVKRINKRTCQGKNRSPLKRQTHRTTTQTRHLTCTISCLHLSHSICKASQQLLWGHKTIYCTTPALQQNNLNNNTN